MVLDFTSALYLGFGHASGSLRPWAKLTTGAPAAFKAPPGATAVQRSLAMLIGCERASLAPSTLHLFWDLFPLLGAPEDAIYVDAEAYPIARWGVERVAARGLVARTFPHRDPAALRSLVRRGGRRPIVVVDGLCPDCGLPAPLRAYLDVVRPHGGQVVVDDTQALGIVGSSPGPSAPYGRGGGGSLRLHGSSSRDLVVAASLAKAFGAPIAVLGGSTAVIDRYESRGDTRVHCSPPCIAALHAAERALALNELVGDRLRRRVARLVSRFRRGLTSLGLSAAGGRFPFQTIEADVHALLLERGVRTVPRRSAVTFLFTAQHQPADVEQALHALDHALKALGARRQRRIR